MFWIPFTKWVDSLEGARAVNYALTITQVRGLEFGAFIYAQEIIESNGKLFAALPLAVGAAIAGGVAATVLGAPWWASAIAALFAAFVVFQIAVGIFARRPALELRGKAVTIRAAVRFGGADEAWFMDNQTLPSLQNAIAYPEFAGWSKGRIADEVRKHYPAADRWLDKHWAKIERAYAKGNPAGGAS